ncbi:MAG: HAD-IA family hydrolase [Dehalococcoidia bacterium]
MTRITHAIFDLDGTLLDTEPIYLEVTAELLARHGRELDPEVRARMMGTPSRDAVLLLAQVLGDAAPFEAFNEERQARLLERFAAVDAMPGAVALTSHLHRHGVPLAVATSSTRDNVEVKTSRHGGWFAAFEAVVTGDDVEHGKPAPDIFLRAADRLGAPPASCLVFEDSPLGVEAALAAGMHVVAVPEAPYRDRVRDAHLVLDTLEAFDPTAWGLPAMPALPLWGGGLRPGVNLDDSAGLLELMEEDER